jgi:hypothetical protein
VAFEVIQPSRPPGRLEVSGPQTPWPARSQVYASPRPLLPPSHGLLPARAGSPLAGQDAHLLDDTQSFMESSHPPIPFDQHCLVALHFLLCCRCCQALLSIFLLPLSSLELCHPAPIGLAASCGVGTSRRQRPSIRAGSNTHHPILYTSFDESWKAYGRRPHLYDGLLGRPGNSTGRLHQHQGQEVTQQRKPAYASLSTAPSGNTPVSRKRHRAMSNFRATATIPIRLKRLPPPPKRWRNQQLRALSGW